MPVAQPAPRPEARTMPNAAAIISLPPQPDPDTAFADHPATISVHNEGDPLEAIIVGTARGAQFPRYDRSCHATFYHDLPRHQVPNGPFPEQVLAEAEEHLDALAALLDTNGSQVMRREPVDCAATTRTPDWASDGLDNYCPRDLLLALDDTVIECPTPVRARYLEARAYRHLMHRAIRAGSRSIAAPRPRLADALYCLPGWTWGSPKARGIVVKDVLTPPCSGVGRWRRLSFLQESIPFKIAQETPQRKRATPPESLENARRPIQDKCVSAGAA